MKIGPIVSTIIIFLNEERFIREAIESVLVQTRTDWELLLVDDGSTDASPGIARDYAARDPERIRYLTHPGHGNMGAGASRTLGLRNARGEYICFLDADDIWQRDKLEREIAILDAHPEVGMSYGQTLLWYSWDSDNPQGNRGKDEVKATGVSPNTTFAPPGLLKLLLIHELFCPACGSVIIRRRVLEEAGGWDADFRGQYEDMVLYAKVLLKNAVYVDGAIHSFYRQHSANSWVADRAAHPFRPEWLAASRLKYLRRVELFLGQQPDVPADVQSALAEALFPYTHTLRFMLTAKGLKATRKSIVPLLKNVVRALFPRR